MLQTVQRVQTTAKVKAKYNHHKIIHSHVITLGLSWNWLTSLRVMSYLPTEGTLHKAVEPISNQTFDRKIRTKSQNLSEDTLEGYAALQSSIRNA